MGGKVVSTEGRKGGENTLNWRASKLAGVGSFVPLTPLKARRNGRGKGENIIMATQLQTEQATAENKAAPIEELTAQQNGALSSELRETRNNLGQMAQTRRMLERALDEARGEKLTGVAGATAREADISARLARHDEAAAKLEARTLEIVGQQLGSVPPQLRADAARRYNLAPEVAELLEGQDARTIEANARKLAGTFATAAAPDATAPGARSFSFQKGDEVAW